MRRGKRSLTKKIADGEKKIIDGENTLKKAEKQYTDGLAEYKTQKNWLIRSSKRPKKELEQAKQALTSQRLLDEGKKGDRRRQSSHRPRVKLSLCSLSRHRWPDGADRKR